MANNKIYLGPNFQAGDSPVVIDVKTDLGVSSIRTVSFINSGPGIAQVELSYDEGVSFEEPVFIHFKIRKGAMTNLGRPSVTPVHVKKRFIRYLQNY